MKYVYKQTPVGILKIVAGQRGLAAVLWENDDPKRVRLGQMRLEDHPVLAESSRQLDEYFAGTRTEFELPLDLAGTEFQKRVWLALARIPFGETRSYGQIATEIGSPGASRVVGANGALTGFAGGLETKARLLKHEEINSAATRVRV